ncbi:MAG: hypothetical protein AAFO03_18430 [Bacteroidota bacterium]
MPALYALVLFVSLTCSLTAQQSYLLPQTSATLYDHLYQVNEAWLMEVSPNEYLGQTQFPSDIERIQRHLELVEGILRERPLDHLSYEQQLRRIKALNHLNAYWKAGQFPINKHLPGRIPIFIDEQNTACAVGHLMLQTGARAIALRIQEENNNADISELLAYQEVPNWAEANGFTAEELAWIQPAYSVVIFTPEPFGSNQGVEGGIINSMLVYNDELYLGGTFGSIDGTTAHKIAIWDGTDLRTLPGLEQDTPGGITRLAIDETTGDIYAIGAFDAFPDADGTVFLARYRAGSWEPILDVTDTDVANFADIACHSGLCYLAGNFSHLQADNTLATLAVFNTSTDEWSSVNPSWTFSGNVNDIDIAAGMMIMGGEFQFMVDQELAGEHYAVINLDDSEAAPLTNFLTLELLGLSLQNVHAVDANSGDFGMEYRLVFDDAAGLAVAMMGSDLSTGAEPMYNLEEEPTISGIISDWGLIYGAFPFPFSEDQDFVLLSSPGESVSAYRLVAQANGALTAVAYFQEQLIVAGDFTQIDEIEANQLAIADLRITDTEDEIPVSDISVSTDGTRILLADLPTSATAGTFELFDTSGKLVWSTPLGTLNAQQVLEPVNLPAAAYVYRLLIDGQLQVGQLALLR